MTTTPTSGAADLPEAGCSKHHLIHCSQCRHDNMVRDLRAENDRLTTQLAALAAAQAPAAQAAVQAGWKLVPLDATDEMVRATDEVNFENGDTDGTLHNVWHVMIAAAPAQPAAQQGAAYAALPDEVVRLAQVAIRECQYKGNDMPQDWMESAMRACRLIAASHGQAPAAPKGGIDE